MHSSKDSLAITLEDQTNSPYRIRAQDLLVRQVEVVRGYLVSVMLMILVSLDNLVLKINID